MRQSAPNRFSVLYVENDSDTFEQVKKSLEEDCSFFAVVDRASSIPATLQKLNRHSYHLLLVEDRLENESGLDLFTAFGKLQKEIPFVLMTAVHDDELVRQ